MEVRKSKTYTLAADEKAVPMMFYTPNALVHGEAVMKTSVRASIWMRTQGAPEYIHLLKAQVIPVGPSGPARPFSYPELLFATTPMLAYHIAPPGQPEGVDYDETEKNRAFETLTAIVGMFLFTGAIRIGATSDINTSLVSGRANWLSLYDVEIHNPVLPQMGRLKIQVVQLRPQALQFGLSTDSL